jgi:hypothetical protein
MRRAFLMIAIATMTVGTAAADDGLTVEQAAHLAALPMKCLHQEFPNKIEHTMTDAKDVGRPIDLHPAFYGCFDWHSSVHGHWMLIRLLKMFPALPEAAVIRAAIDLDLTAAHITAEVAYFNRANRGSYERTYGWAWLLALATELHGWDDADGKRWEAALAPLTQVMVTKYQAFLPKQNYPIRTGVHPNTAFGLALALDYARAVGDAALETLIVERARSYYGGDRGYPIAWEPSGEDFLSPALTEADLMRRVLPPKEFVAWLRRFMPELTRGKAKTWLAPAVVIDRTDPKLAHLDGLNLSRAWNLRAIAGALPARTPMRTTLATAAAAHATVGLAHVATGDYVGEHWLASFAILLLSTPAP